MAAPPVNLKERIAALQQRSVSPHTHQSAQGVPRGLPSPGPGGLRDRIAKFEEKGGTPVPRGSFATGAPQLAENVPPKKRGELYGNRIPSLGRPTGPPRPASPEPTSDEPVVGPRKRCISTGTGLSKSPSPLSTDEPVPPLPTTLIAPTPRRNSLAVSFGSGKRVMDTPPEKPPEHTSPADSLASATSTNGASQSASVDQPDLPHPSPSIPTPPSPAPSLIPPNVNPPSPSPSPTPALADIPTPPPEETAKPCRDSTITISVPNPSPSIPSPTLTIETPVQTKSTFKAVVHRKVMEQPSVPSLAPPPAPQVIKQRRITARNDGQVPPSPAFGDLAGLLEDAAMLELRLTEGDGTGLRAKDTVPNTPTPTSTTFQTDARIEHAHMPSIDSGSQSERSMSIPSIREPLIDGEIPEGEETDGRSLASTTFSQRSPSHRKYLTNIYRLTSRRSSGYMPGAYPRDSMSMSSEDSSPVTTPSDNGKRKGFGIAWPSGSPKKGGPNMGRSSSFADKIFNRSRTRSNVSTADQASERNSLYEASQPNITIQPSLTISFPSELSPDGHPDGVDIARPTSWMSPGDSNPEFSPASSVLDKDIFDAFPSVPQTLPPGFHLDAENAGIGRASTLPVHGRKQVNPRLSVV